MILERDDTISIFYSPDGGDRLRLAAEELTLHLGMLGIKAIHTSGLSVGDKRMLLGSGWDAASDRETEKFASDEVLIREIDLRSILLTGAGERGTLNAAYVFLEEILGFVWFNASETHVPSSENWDLTGLNFRYNPPFERRCISAAASLDAMWCLRTRLNSFMDESRLPDNPALADSVTFAGKHCHNVYKLLSLGFFGTREDPMTPFENPYLIRELHRAHPEYFALYEGRRDPYPGSFMNADHSVQSGNISLTNDDVFALLVRGGRLLLDHHPTAQLISLSLRDNYHYCDEARRTPGGVTGAMIRLVNRFAGEIAKSHPKVRVEYLAYHGTQSPPEEGRFHPNVIVRYCPIRVSQFHAFDESEHNVRGGLNYETPPSMAQPVKQISRWRSMAERVSVWYYSLHVPFFHPQPSLRGHGRTFRLLQHLGVSGVYIQDNMPMEQNCFNDLRVHLLTRLLWNPQLDVEKESQRFCRLYYGPAAAPVQKYIALLHDESVWDWENWIESDGASKWAKDGREESWDWFGDVPDEQYPKPHFYTLYRTRPPLKPEFFERGEVFVREAAEAVSGQKVFEQRVNELRMSFYFGVLAHPPGDAGLEAEAKEWFEPRYAQLKNHYRGKEFYGLDHSGLSWPKPIPKETMAACGSF